MSTVHKSLSELSTLIRQAKLSLHTLAEELIQRVEEINPVLNAIVRFDPELIRSEVRRVEALQAKGQKLPLLGMTFTVKDNIWVKGQVVSQGSLLFKDFVAPESAVCVTRLQDTGAMLLGVTNSSEFACKGVTTNKLFGSTSNPWNLALTPGGSSGGAASAISAGLGMIALATDAGGSVRRPASHTGVIGMKPSQGSIPHPIGFAEPVFNHSVIGLLGRRVEDIRLAMSVMNCVDRRDVMSAGVVPTNYKSLKEISIAYSSRLGLGFPVDNRVQKAVANTLANLKDQGCQIREVDPPWPKGLSESVLMPLQFAGLAELYGEQWREDPSIFDSDIAVQIEQGLALSATSVAKALFLREELNQILVGFQETYDLLVTPTTPCVAWDKNLLGPLTIEGQQVMPRAHAVFTPIFNHTFVPACSVPCYELVDGLPVGLQVVGRRNEDQLVLDVVAAIEKARNTVWEKVPFS